VQLANNLNISMDIGFIGVKAFALAKLQWGLAY
jgi:hypothetical protein